MSDLRFEIEHMQRFKGIFIPCYNLKGCTAKSFSPTRPPVPRVVGCVGEVEIRLTVWLCMIRSRLPYLQSRILDEICRRGARYRIERPYAPIDRVMRVWMEDVLHENKLIQTSDLLDSRALPILYTVIESILREAHEVSDYRAFFICLMDKINVYVECLVRGIHLDTLNLSPAVSAIES